jgi:hypothetical protein
MADQLYVLNQALAHLGEPSQDNLAPGTLREASRKVLYHLPQALDAVLERDGWLLARSYVTLTAAARAGNFKYGYSYDLPADFVRVWTNASGWGGPWELGSFTDEVGATRKVIWARTAGPINLCYIRRLPFEALSAGMVDAVSLDAAARACQPVNGSVERAQQLRSKAEQAIMLAMGADGVQDGDQDVPISDPLADLRGASNDFRGGGYGDWRG